MYKYNNILVTGGNGNLGSQIVKVLKNILDDDVKIFSPSSSELNLLDTKKTFDYIRDNNIDCVYHSAGRVGGLIDNINNPAYALAKLCVYEGDFVFDSTDKSDAIKKFNDNPYMQSLCDFKCEDFEISIQKVVNLYKSECDERCFC